MINLLFKNVKAYTTKIKANTEKFLFFNVLIIYYHLINESPQLNFPLTGTKASCFRILSQQKITLMNLQLM